MTTNLKHTSSSSATSLQLTDRNGAVRTFRVGSYAVEMTGLRVRILDFLTDGSVVCITADLRDAGTRFIADSTCLVLEEAVTLPQHAEGLVVFA